MYARNLRGSRPLFVRTENGRESTLTYRRRLRAEIDRLRALAAESGCDAQTRQQLFDLISEMEQHLNGLDRAPLDLGDDRVLP